MSVARETKRAIFKRWVELCDRGKTDVEAFEIVGKERRVKWQTIRRYVRDYERDISEFGLDDPRNGKGGGQKEEASAGTGPPPKLSTIDAERGYEPLQDYNGSITKELYLNDLHCPYHDRATWDLVLRFAEWFKPGRTFLNGDLLDFYPISFFSKDPRRAWENNLQMEIDVARYELRALRTALPETLIYFTEGNHEKRLLRWLWKQDQAASLRVLEFENLLELSDFDPIEWWPEDQLLWDRGFLITHGQRVSMHSSYTAKMHFEMYRANMIIGHTHRIGSFYRTIRTEKGYETFASYENGCLADFDQCDYMVSPNWQQGFAVSYHMEKPKDHSRFFLIQIPIVNRKFIFDGRLWSA